MFEFDYRDKFVYKYGIFLKFMVFFLDEVIGYFYYWYVKKYYYDIVLLYLLENVYGKLNVYRYFYF